MLHVLTNKLRCSVMVVYYCQYPVLDGMIVLPYANVDREEEVDGGEDGKVKDGAEEIADRLALLGGGPWLCRCSLFLG